MRRHPYAPVVSAAILCAFATLVSAEEAPDLALDYALTLQEYRLDREAEQVAQTPPPGPAAWRTGGPESCRRGPWLTEFPAQSVIERTNRCVAGVLERGTIREPTLPGVLLGMTWAFTSRRSDYFASEELEASIRKHLPALAEGVSSWQATEEKVHHEFSRASCTSTVWDLCNLLRRHQASFAVFPEEAVRSLETSVRVSAHVMCQPTEAGSLWVWQTRQPWRVARLMMTLLVGYKTSGDTSYLDDVPMCLHFLRKDIDALGGFRYSSLDPLRNVQTYMDQTILELGNFLLHANDENTVRFREEARAILAALRPNYLYRCLPAGTYDYSAVPNGFGLCKTLWYNPPRAYAPMILAMATGDGRCATMARYMSHYFMGFPGELQYGFYLTLRFAERMRTVTPEPLPARYIVADDPVRGIRILDDEFACVFNRVAEAPTILGARTARTPERRYLGWRGAYGTVLQAVAPEVGRTPWKFTEEGPRNRRSSLRNAGRYATFGDRLLRSHAAAFAASYRLEGAANGGARSSHPWQVHQVWFYREKRMVGLVLLTSLEEQKAPYAGQYIQFNHLEAIEETAERTYRAGDFTVRILATDLPLAEVGPCQSYCTEQPVDGLRGREIRLTDKPTDNPEPKEYAAGQRFATLLEMGTSEAMNEAIQATPVVNDAFVGLRLAWGGERYLLAYRTEPDVGQIHPQELGIPLTAEFHPGERQCADWYDRRHPSRDREKPKEFFYNLPQHGLMLLQW